MDYYNIPEEFGNQYNKKLKGNSYYISKEIRLLDNNDFNAIKPEDDSYFALVLTIAKLLVY